MKCVKCTSTVSIQYACPFVKRKFCKFQFVGTIINQVAVGKGYGLSAPVQLLRQKVFVNAVPCSKNQPVSIRVVNGKAVALPYKGKQQRIDKIAVCHTKTGKVTLPGLHNYTRLPIAWHFSWAISKSEITVLDSRKPSGVSR